MVLEKIFELSYFTFAKVLCKMLLFTIYLKDTIVTFCSEVTFKLSLMENVALRPDYAAILSIFLLFPLFLSPFTGNNFEPSNCVNLKRLHKIQRINVI